jgi:hypothetical protein
MSKLCLAKIRAEQGARQFSEMLGTIECCSGPGIGNQADRKARIGFFSDRAEHLTELGHAQVTRFWLCRAPKLLDEAFVGSGRLGNGRRETHWVPVQIHVESPSTIYVTGLSWDRIYTREQVQR